MALVANYIQIKNIPLYMNEDLNIGDFIYKYRMFKGVTQEELAERSQLQQPQISRIERNKNVKLSTVVKVLDSLGLKLISDDDSYAYFHNENDALMLGSLIAYKRKINQITQQKLAEMTNLKQPQIVQIEKNNDITMATLQKILKVIDLKLKIVDVK